MKRSRSDVRKRIQRINKRERVRLAYSLTGFGEGASKIQLANDETGDVLAFGLAPDEAWSWLDGFVHGLAYGGPQ